MLYCRNISNKVVSIKEVLDNEHPIQLSELKRTEPAKITAVLVKFIEGTIDWFGYKKEEMPDSRIIMLVNSIMEKYYYLSIEDVCLCFKKGREDASYDKFYGRLDCSVFLKWFAKYDKERESALQSHPSNNRPAVDLSNGVPFEDYEEEMLARIAGGDLYANEQYQRMKSVQELFRRNMGVFKNYQYNRKHRFDDR